MIQFNLLPDIKLEYIKAARTKRLLVSTSILVIAAVLLLVGFLSVVTFSVRGTHLRNLSTDVEAKGNELTGTESIDKILTIQNQLSTLTSLHEQKPQASRLYDMIAQITPDGVFISGVTVDFAEGVISIEGQAVDLSKVNEFVDTIKFADYQVVVQPEDAVVVEDGSLAQQQSEKIKAFNQVVLASFGLEDTLTAYTIDFKYDPILFDNTKNIKISVQQGLVTTRSQLEKPVFTEKEEDQ